MVNFDDRFRGDSDEFRAKMKEIFESQRPDIDSRGAWFMNWNDFKNLDSEKRRVIMGIDPAVPGSDKVIVTEVVEPGHMIYAKISPPKPLGWASPPPMSFRYDEFSKRMVEQIARAYMIPAQYFEPEPYRWQRWLGESLMAWGNRLFERGLLDDPDIRWMYQRACLGLPFALARRVLVEVWDKVLDVLEVVFHGR